MKPNFARKGAPGTGSEPAAVGAREAIEAADPRRPEYRACCCPGRPIIRVVVPASGSRPAPADLLLCGHHYRVSQAALGVAGATVEELPGRAADVAAALFREPQLAAGPVC
ncbi:MAG: hypothetical protein ACLPQY_27395 [Streptosporangiaceae bacterium]